MSFYCNILISQYCVQKYCVQKHGRIEEIKEMSIVY